MASASLLDAHKNPIRTDWTRDEVKAIYDAPFNDLLFAAQQVHRSHFDANTIQASTLMSIKTGACPEDCKYCSQSGHYNTGLEKKKLENVKKVIEKAKLAKEQGASRFCMGAAWKHPSDKDFVHVLDMVREVKALGLETCATLGMLRAGQAEALKEAGLDYYNHNLDTSEEYYQQIISTRSYEDRLNTLDEVRKAGMNVCCGGIVGMGETKPQRIDFLTTLASLPEHPQSVPINKLVPIKGTPLGETTPIEDIELIRTIATARILMPKSYVRLSAGRTDLPESAQAMCFLAGANSIFHGDELLTTPNPDENTDAALLQKLGIRLESEVKKESEKSCNIAA